LYLASNARIMWILPGPATPPSPCASGAGWTVMPCA